MGALSSPNPGKKEDKNMTAKVTFNTERCKGCELCVSVCPKHIVAIDTGCLWGGKLTAARFPDRRIFQEICPQWAAPGC